MIEIAGEGKKEPVAKCVKTRVLEMTAIVIWHYGFCNGLNVMQRILYVTLGIAHVAVAPVAKVRAVLYQIDFCQSRIVLLPGLIELQEFVVISYPVICLPLFPKDCMDCAQ